MARYDLSDEAWAIIEHLLPTVLTSPQAGRPWAEHRKIVNGMFWILCSGAPWRDLPERYGPWKTVYNRFNRWSKSGVINIIFNKLLSFLDAHGLVLVSHCAGWQQYPCAQMCGWRSKKHPDITNDNSLGRSERSSLAAANRSVAE